MEVSPHLQMQLKALPDKPGVYQYFDAEEKILYVGKAKSLKKRVSSYFTKDHSDSGKTRVLVSKIVDIKTIVVETELDALLLENNLIKKYQPRYNVALKDDKTFPWICIKKERFPRIFPTRKVIKDGSEYYGPYPNVRMMYALLDFIKSMYPRRKCSLVLEPIAIENGKFKVCLEYHIKNCLAPCVGFQTEPEYMSTIQEIRQILKGNMSELISVVRKRMMDHAAEYRFEIAQELKERLELLEQYKSKKNVFLVLHIPQAKWTEHAIDTPDFFELIHKYPNVRAGFHGHVHDQDGVFMARYIPFLFDSHLGGSWGTP
jgi:excinuclease ABC subunit C